jgi:hypothetical protein
MLGVVEKVALAAYIVRMPFQYVKVRVVAHS